MLCNMCPRKCNIERDKARGVCGCGNDIVISRTVRHFWEEPCISGTQGSGCIFFSGCNLKCIYCQNYTISKCANGKTLTKSDFQRLALNISSSGVHNINLVTPTHFTKQVARALAEIKKDIKVPIVWNSSGYDLPESIKELDGIVDVFLCDIKYKSSELSREYSSASDYFTVAKAALGEMIKAVGAPMFDKDGILLSGVIARHLVLPGARSDSLEIIQELEEFKDDILLSLMCQYTPTPEVAKHGKLSRRTTSLEYNAVVKRADELQFKGYTQDKASARAEYTPNFSESWDFIY